MPRALRIDGSTPLARFLSLLTSFLPARFLLCTLVLPACAEQRAPEQDGAAPRTDGGENGALSFTADADAGAENVDAQRMAQDSSAATAAEAAAADAQFDDSTVKPGLRVSIVSPEHWTLLDAGEDPFADRLSVVDCLTAGVTAETLSDELVLGVETGWCAYLTARQPTRLALAVGDVLKVRLWHFELSAPEPAEAHAALVVAGLSVLDERIAIPQAGGLIVRQLRVEQAIPAGAPVYFHLHNHGANSWALVEVSAGPAETAQAGGDAAVSD